MSDTKHAPVGNGIYGAHVYVGNEPVSIEANVADARNEVLRRFDAHEQLVAALEAVRSQPGFEPDEPYGQQVISALKSAAVSA